MIKGINKKNICRNRKYSMTNWILGNRKEVKDAWNFGLEWMAIYTSKSRKKKKERKRKGNLLEGERGRKESKLSSGNVDFDIVK